MIRDDACGGPRNRWEWWATNEYKQSRATAAWDKRRYVCLSTTAIVAASII
ncbi:hypothetical protein [Streptomyces olivaceiscleroticus]|uniref:Transposase n=1 Tax=Streptomyces olivaceiscleroticus TaxID=68245 RepID=A0ABP3JY66_9ACTN